MKIVKRLVGIQKITELHIGKRQFWFEKYQKPYTTKWQLKSWGRIYGKHKWVFWLVIQITFNYKRFSIALR